MDQRKLLALIEELKSRKRHPFNTFEPYNDAQNNFLKSAKYIRLLFGGNRSGKSHCAAYDAIRTLSGQNSVGKNYNRPRVWCISSEYRTLAEGLWHHIDRMLPKWWIKKRSANIPGWGIPLYIQLKDEYGGGRIDFISGQGGEEARRKLQAARVDGVYIDEEIDGLMFHELEMRLLDTGGHIVISATLVRSEDWILELEREAEEGSPDVDVYRLKTDENPHLTKEAVSRIYHKLSPEEREVRIYGLSRKTTGVIYRDQWVPELVVEPRELDPKHYRLVAIDPGFRVFAALFLSYDRKEKEYILYDEIYLRETTLEKAAKEIKNRTSVLPVDEYIIDPAGFRHREDGGPGVAIVLQTHHDIPVSPAQNDIQSGIEITRSMIARKKFRVFNTLKNFLFERSRYRFRPPSTNRDRDEGGEKPLSRDDHLMDCWRYLNMWLAELDPIEFDTTVDWANLGIKYGITLDERMERDKKRLQRRARDQVTAQQYAAYA
jgi:hypothetical protein